MPGSEVKKYIIRALKTNEQIPLAKKLIRKFKTKTKRKSRKNKSANSPYWVLGFEEENLYKKEVNVDGKSIKFYYSVQVVQYLKEGNFNLVFIDGTHLKTLGKNQVTLIRFYSTEMNKIITGFYLLNPSKKERLRGNIRGTV